MKPTQEQGYLNCGASRKFLLALLSIVVTDLAFLSPACAQPFSATQQAAPVTTNSATLNGMAVPNGQDSVAWFEWGGNGTFTMATSPTNVGSGFGVVRVTAMISGLDVSRYYSSRLVVSNTIGLKRGLEQRFVTGGKVIGWGITDGRAAVPGSLRDAVAVDSFGPFGLALRAGGDVVAWGRGGTPQAGANIPAALGNVLAIAAGSTHSLALREGGTVVSWGSRTTVPVGLSNVIAVAAGGSSMALKTDGSVVIWAADGSLVTNPLSSLSNVVAISAGSGSSYLALKADGTVAASGGTPLPAGLSNIVAITSGQNHNLALQADGTVRAWGSWGTGSVSVPASVSNIVAIAGGANHDLVLKADGSLVAWGNFISEIQLRTPAFVPAYIGSNVCAIASGQDLCLALRPLSPEDFIPYAHTQPASLVTTNSATLNGMVVANGLDTAAWFEWGSSTNYANTTGMFSGGNGTSVSRVSLAISGLAANADYYYRLVASNAAGVKFGFGSRLTTGRKIAAWGVINGSTPKPPLGIGPVVKIGSGHIFALALKADGRVIAWGNSSGGSAATVPANLTNVVEIAAGYSHGLAIRDDTTVVAWGTSMFGTATNVPPGLSNTVAVAGGDNHSLALKADGTVVAWGDNTFGQTNVPAGLYDVVAVAAGADFSVALRADGTVVAWGSGTNGRTSVPLNLSKVVAVSATVWNTLALKEDGTVVTWGALIYGPPSGLTNVVGVAAGSAHNMALKADGTVVVWGDNTYGQKNLPPGLVNVVSIASGDNHCLALAPNLQPQATNASVTGLLNNDITMILPMSDPNNDTLSARVSTLPVGGDLYQYAAGIRGDLVSLPNTPVTDASGRLIFAPASDALGAPYSSFTFVANDGESDSAGATMTINIIPPFSVNVVLPGGGGAAAVPFGLSFGGVTNLSYRVWASTNLANWTLLGSATQPTPGVFQFTDIVSTNFARRFYRVSSP